MKKILKELWTRTKFVFGVSLTAIIMIVTGVFKGTEKGLGILTSILNEVTYKIGKDE